MYGLKGILCASLGHTTASHAKIFFICLFGFVFRLFCGFGFTFFFGGSVARAEGGSNGMRE